MNETLAKRLLGACVLVGVTLVLTNLLPAPQALPPAEATAKRVTFDLKPAPPAPTVIESAPEPASPTVVAATAPEATEPQPAPASAKVEQAPPPPPKPAAKPAPKPGGTAKPKPKPVVKAAAPPVEPPKPELEVANAEAPAPMPVEAAPPEPAPQSKPESWFVQIGAFAQEANARQSLQKLQKAGLKAQQDTLAWKAGTRYRVRCGPFASKEEAEAERGRAAALGFGDARLAHEPPG